MSTVGDFPGLNASRRRTVRAPINPLDKSTIVSIYPKVINEIKHTIQPGRFHIDAGSYERPALLVVGPSSWWKEIDEEQPILEIPNSSIQIADAIVRDYCNGLLACNMGDCMPGLFWIPGSFTIVEIKKSYQHLVDKAEINQKRYFTALVKLADSLWARTNGNPLVVSDDMRLGAKYLGLNTKDWMKDFTMIEKTSCPACGSPRSIEFPVCPVCHAIIDKVKAKELGISFAA
jgi:hypothetical protein